MERRCLILKCKHMSYDFNKYRLLVEAKTQLGFILYNFSFQLTLSESEKIASSKPLLISASSNCVNVNMGGKTLIEVPV